jgi:putative DNA primase/helicase
MIGDAHAHNMAEDAIEIARLAALSKLAYERERKEAAEKLGISRLSILDRLVEEARGGKGNSRTGPGRPLSFDEPEPWPQPVAGATLLDELALVCRRHVVMSEAAAHAIALWIVHTYLFLVVMITPRLAIKSAQKRSGKTTLLMIIGELAARPLSTANITAPAVYRTIELARPTLVVDEADTFVSENDELRGVLNAGYMRGGQVIRTTGDDHDPRIFSCWCPVAIAAIRRLPDTIEDRAIAIVLKRRRRDEDIMRLRIERLAELAPLARKARRWAVDYIDRLGTADPSIPNQLNDRAADCWRVLIAIADLAGGPWPVRAREAALTLSADNNDVETVGTRLLADLRELFDADPSGVLFSEEIVAALVAMEDRPWPEWGKSRQPITKVQVARLLDHFQINPKTVRRAMRTDKGYRRDQFDDVFERYLAPKPGF